MYLKLLVESMREENTLRKSLFTSFETVGKNVQCRKLPGATLAFCDRIGEILEMQI
jgi:hypothetical protein